jgi:hypothetical protein
MSGKPDRHVPWFRLRSTKLAWRERPNEEITKFEMKKSESVSNLNFYDFVL